MVLFDWGATEDEMLRRLPGDDLIPHPTVETTRATTVHATPAEIWPWLVQIGQGRGGFYSYDWLENLFGLDIHSTDELVPVLQDLGVGDVIRLHPESQAHLEVHSLDPEHFLVLQGRSEDEEGEGEPPHGSQASWSFVLVPLDEEHTRLVVRLRASAESTLTVLGWRMMLPIDLLMERKMLLGVKHRAQREARQRRSRGRGTAEL